MRPLEPVPGSSLDIILSIAIIAERAKEEGRDI